MSINAPYKSPAELPNTIPIFPLAGVLLLPRGELPLNIFEPRYLAMIDDALERAIQRRDRVLLLITGHHRPGEPPVQRGRIRATVHDWLTHSRHASEITAVRGAHPRHGGGGSLYIILRRQN